MSFSGEIKQELCEHYAKARHCNLAELSAIAHVCGEFSEDRHGECLLAFHTENLPVARKCFTLMKKTFNIDTNIVVRHNPIKDSCILKERSLWQLRTQAFRQFAVSGLT